MEINKNADPQQLILFIINFIIKDKIQEEVLVLLTIVYL